MIDFIVKYWVEVLFTLICSGLAFVVRHHVKLVIEAKKRATQDMLDKIDNKFDKKFEEQNEGMTKKMGECYNSLIQVVRESEERSMEEDRIIHSEIDVIKDGMLSIEGRAFRNECRKLLEPDHIITLNEYEAIVSEHETYNRLGGNHEGDLLFAAVRTKYERALQAQADVEQ